MYNNRDGQPDLSFVSICTTEEKGRHIVCDRFIPGGSVIGRIPVVVVPQTEVELLRSTLLFNYVFEWDPEERYKITKDLVQCDRRYHQGIALGPISLCNHSHTPNSDYEFDYDGSHLIWRALRDIVAGEDVTIHYKVPIWFQMHDDVEVEVAAQ